MREGTVVNDHAEARLHSEQALFSNCAGRPFACAERPVFSASAARDDKIDA